MGQSIASDDGVLNVGFCFVCVGHARNDLIPADIIVGQPSGTRS